MVYRGNGAAREGPEGHSALFLSALHLPLCRRCRGDEKQLVGKLSRRSDDQPAWLGETLHGYGVQHWPCQTFALDRRWWQFGRWWQLSPVPALLLLIQVKKEEAGKELQGYELLQTACLGPSCPVCNWQRQVSGGDGPLAPFC